MKANEKRKTEIYRLIDLWKNGKKSQKAICEEAGISFHVFKYWLKKQRAEQAADASENKNGKFFPITVKTSINFEKLQIVYPNGVTVNCTQTLTLHQLKELIKLY